MSPITHQLSVAALRISRGPRRRRRRRRHRRRRRRSDPCLRVRNAVAHRRQMATLRLGKPASPLPTTTGNGAAAVAST